MNNKERERKARVSDENIVAAYREYLSAYKAGVALGVSPDTVYRVLKISGEPLAGVEYWRESRRRFTKDRGMEILAGYESGLGYDDLVAKFGGTAHSIRTAITRSGGVLRPVTPPLSAKERSEVLRRFAAGESQQGIADGLGRSQATVSRFLRSEGHEYTVRTGQSHGMWKGGRFKSGKYWRIQIAPDDLIAEMRDCHGYVLEHRVEAARQIGRPLRRSETVHHINGDPNDNSLENLQLRQGRHGKHVAYRCLDCGSHNVEPAPLQ